MPAALLIMFLAVPTLAALSLDFGTFVAFLLLCTAAAGLSLETRDADEADLPEEKAAPRRTATRFAARPDNNHTSAAYNVSIRLADKAEYTSLHSGPYRPLELSRS